MINLIKMKCSVYSMGIFLQIFFEASTLVAPQPQTTTTKILTYKIVKHTDQMKVNLVLSGTAYTSKYCHIKKLNDAGNDYGEIDTCPENNTGTNTGQCVRACTGDDIRFAYDKFSPRTKYVEVFVADTTEAVNTKVTDPTIFGLEIPLLVNPQVTTTTTTENKLKFSTITCKNVDCPIYYKGVEYAPGTKGGSCIEANDTNNDNKVEFDLMIPHYEMKCASYPSFFYKLQNKYTLMKTDVYVPQYYVTYNKEKTKYFLKFTNKFPFEICKFSIKKASTEITESTTNDYKSNCGAANKDCYAPCNNVELIFEASEGVVEILIQSRHFPLQKFGAVYYGYKQKKYVVTETDAADDSGKLLSNYLATGVTLNVPLFKPSDINTKFSECTVSYYAADKPMPTATIATSTGAKCSSTSEPTSCLADCATSLTIIQLTPGKPYILEIAAAGTAPGETNKIPANFKEHIFFRTKNDAEKTFPIVSPTIRDTGLSIKALTVETPISKTSTTCAYYLSPRGKDTYVCAMCVDSYPCRGYCGESQTIVGLSPGTDYDLKVVAHEGYDFKVHQIRTVLSTLTLEKQMLDRGFKVTGSLSSPYPAAVCHYKVKVKQGEDYGLIYECPARTPTRAAGSSTLVSTSKMGVARSSGDQRNVNAATATNTNTISSCQAPPLCSNIIFSEGYESDRDYQVLVTAVGRSIEVSINIPKNPLLSQPTDLNKQLIVVITRVDKTLTVSTTLPQGLDENALCKWQLKNSGEPSNPIVKKCMTIGKGCTQLPRCKEFTITEVEDIHDYHLTLFYNEDPNTYGVGIIKQGESSNKSTSKNTIIISVIVPVVIVVIGIGFYFGYMKNKN